MYVVWYACLITVLCWNLKPSVVSAAIEKLGPNRTQDWLEKQAHIGVGDIWSISSSSELQTDVGSGRGFKVGESWLITSLLKQSKIACLNINATPSRCSGQKLCNLLIYGFNGSISSIVHSIGKNRVDYIKKNVVFLGNMTFNDSIRGVQTIVITRPFPRLAVQALGRSTQPTQWTIHAIEMYYYYCMEGTVNNIALARVDSLQSGFVNVTANCSINAVVEGGQVAKFTARCSPKGEWTVTGDQTCVCKAGFGYQPIEGCLRCNPGYFKRNISNMTCTKCPKNMISNSLSTKCKCKENFYVGRNQNGPCYGLPPKVRDLRATWIDKGWLNITWSKPLVDGGLNRPLSYSIESYSCNESSKCKRIQDLRFDPGSEEISSTFVIASNVRSDVKYKFRVYSKNNLPNVSNDKWNFSEIKLSNYYPSTDSGIKEDRKDPLFMYIGGVAGFLIIACLIVIVVITRMRRMKAKGYGVENDGFENGVTLPTIGQKSYVDPSNYDDPEAALRDLANEISPKSLNLQRVLGGGEFGDVYKGTLTTSCGSVIDIAAKTLKHDSNERSRKDFFLEASAMAQFKDLNVIHLEGVITKSIPHMIVTEYMSNGSLDNFLKQNDEKLTDLQLVGMARGVASGMTYLAGMNFVHRDLAARNILVNDMLLCKVADFGLSRTLETADSSRGEYCTTGGKIPVRWTAPEAIKYRKFSTASDVWSYGILLWEIMSFAERPYWDWDNFKVVERVDEGYRLTAPKNCPKAVHELMLLCWNADRSERPSFEDIVKMVDAWIRSPETIRYPNNSKTASLRPSSVCDTSMLVKEWLTDIGMSSYIPQFTQAGFIQLSDLAGLLDSDLQAIGVSLIGHRNKMLRTIRSLPITDKSLSMPWNRAASLKV